MIDTTSDLYRDEAAEQASREDEYEASIGLGHGFVVVVGYTSAAGEVADHTLTPADYTRTVERSREAIADLTPERVAAECPPCRGDVELAALALQEVRASWQRTLAGQSEAPEVYTAVAPGVSRHNGNGEFYVWGLAVHGGKRVAVPGAYRPVKHAAKTLVKRWIEGLAPVSRFRRFRLRQDGSNWTALRFQGLEIRPEPGPTSAGMDGEEVSQ